MGFLYVLEGLRTPFLDKLFSAVTFLGGEGVFVALAVILFWCVDKRKGYFLMAAGVAGTVANQFLKIVCQVPRPWVRDPEFTIVESAREGAGGYSFPSGHSQNAAVAYGGLARLTRGWVRWLCGALVILVCFSRMYLGVHTPADVAVGLICGLVLVGALWPVFRRSDKKPGLVPAVFAVIVAIALAALVYVEAHPWPADIDQDNLYEARKNGYTMLGIALAVLVAAPLERRYVNFDTKAPRWAQVLKVTLGLIVVMGLRMGLKPVTSALFGGHPAEAAARYFIMVLTAILVWPLTFKWFAGRRSMGRKAIKALVIAGIILLILAMLAGALYWVVTRDTSETPQDVPEAQNPLITPLGTTMLSGHRAGGGTAPENTLRALENSAHSPDYHLDIFEFDVHLTADGVLVLLHDETLDRTSDAAEVFGEENVDVGTRTFAELQTLNMGAKFTAEDGSMPFADLHGEEVPEDLRIISLDQALEYLESAGDFRYIIEIKNGDELGFEAADKLYAALTAFGALERTVVGTFHNEVTAYMDETYPDMLRSAGVKEVVQFYLCALLGLERDNGAFPYQALQIPTTDYVVNLGTSRVVNYAHAHDIAVQYWTINDPDEMARLQSIGADAVMTDLPNVGASVLNQP